MMNLDRIGHWFNRKQRKNPDVFAATGLSYMPTFKRNATTAELLRELALVAEQHPERFTKWVLVYCEDNDKRFMVRYLSGPTTRTSECFSVLAAGQQHIWQDSSK
jgi:hypothetical protein